MDSHYLNAGGGIELTGYVYPYPLLAFAGVGLLAGILASRKIGLIYGLIPVSGLILGVILGWQLTPPHKK
jgi:hypothetical protein